MHAIVWSLKLKSLRASGGRRTHLDSKGLASGRCNLVAAGIIASYLTPTCAVITRHEDEIAQDGCFQSCVLLCFNARTGREKTSFLAVNLVDA